MTLSGLWSPRPPEPRRHPLHPPHDLLVDRSGMAGIAPPALSPVAPRPTPVPIAIPVGPRHALRHQRKWPLHAFHLVMWALADALRAMLGWPLAAWHQFGPRPKIRRTDCRRSVWLKGPR
jgi:hypothetical protein